MAKTPDNLLAEMPAGAFRTSLEALAPPVRTRVLEKLLRLQVPREDYGSLDITSNGQLFYTCAPADKYLSAASAAYPSSANASSTTRTAEASVPIAQPPLRHSKPGATNVLYLDFNGHTIKGTLWNIRYNQETFVAQPFDLDGDATTFSDTEQAWILEIWSRVAEDFAPFNVDVTTEEPASFTNTTGRALITESVDATGLLMPADKAGGVAFLDVFGESDYATFRSPVFVYNKSSSSIIAETISHEFGHNMGLSHDGRSSPVEEYYEGHGTGDSSWGPIMGAAFDCAFSQWSKGEYAQANNQQNDLDIIAGKLASVADEASNVIAGAKPPTLNTTTGVIEQKGIITGVLDSDVYLINTVAGKIDFSLSTFSAASFASGTDTRGANLNILAELLDANGLVISTANPLTSADATLSYNIPSTGVYYLRIRGAGEGTPLATTPSGFTSYGSVGTYQFTGTFIASPPIITSADKVKVGIGQLFEYQIVATNSPVEYRVLGLPAEGITFDKLTGKISGRYKALGNNTYSIVAINGIGIATATLTVEVVSGPPAFTEQTRGIQYLGKQPLNLEVSFVNYSGTAVLQWKRNGVPIVGATGTTFKVLPSESATGYYTASVTNDGKTYTETTPIFVMAMPKKSKLIGWGDNTDGAITASRLAALSAPDNATPPASYKSVVRLAAGSLHVLAQLEDDTIQAWGANGYGQTTVPSEFKVSKTGSEPKTIVGLAAGYTHSLALKDDGKVVGWGFSGYATPPAGLDNVVAIAAGYFHSLALKSDGTVVAWGYNNYGQTSVPDGLKDVAAVTAHGYHSLALKRDGTVVGWGYNQQGQATPPAGLTVTTLSAGYSHSLGLRTDNTIAYWGDANYAKPPAALTSIVALASGDYHSLALKVDGTLTAWGFTGSGLTAIPAAVPKPADQVYQVIAGENYTIALCAVKVTAEASLGLASWSAKGDDDRDGVPNLLEYALNLDPAKADAEGLPTVGVENGHLTLTYLRRKNVSDIAYVVEVSPDLTTWLSGAGYTEEISVKPLGPVLEEVVVRDVQPLAQGRRYIHLRIVK